MTQSEHQWLETACPYLTPSYLSYLKAYRYKPEQVRITFVPVSDDGLFGNVEIEATGPWAETIFWEVPLMSCLSETYFQSVITDWDYRNQEGKPGREGLLPSEIAIYITARVGLCQRQSIAGGWMCLQ